MSFYLFFYHPKLKELLLSELKIHHPELTLSFSNKEFISMKGPEKYSAKLRKRPLVFARRMAVFIDKSSVDSEESVKVGQEYWNYRTVKSLSDTFMLGVSKLPGNAPARAWHKIDEFIRQFNIELKEGESVIEIGSAPGGISYYLLEKKLKLTSIDPAFMDEKIKKYPLFKHIKKSIFDVKREELPLSCDYLVSDLNLNGDLNTNQCKRIAKMYPRLKAGFLTIKTPNEDELKHFDKWIKCFMGYKTVLIHLPSHRKEIGLYFYK